MSDERGRYRPLDRAANPLIGWGAERGVRYAGVHAVHRALQPVAPLIGLAERTWRAGAGARGVYRASRVFGGRDAAAAPLAQVGAEWWHGAEDRSTALLQIAAALVDLVHDLSAEIAARRDAANAKPTPDAVRALEADTKWLAADIEPTLREWKAFAERESGSTWTLVATDWQVFERWLDRVRNLRQLARARGFVLSSPEPADLPSTVWERASEGAGGAFAWLGLLKLTAAAAIGIAGFAGLYAALRGK